IKRLMEAGIQPHIIACRATAPVQPKVMEKIAMFSNVPLGRVFSMHDRPSVYSIPEEMRAAALDREILSVVQLHDRVDLSSEDAARQRWGAFVRKLQSPPRHSITIGVAGKYTGLQDAYASIGKAVEHCGTHLLANIDLRWIETTEVTPKSCASMLSDLDGVIVPGGFGARGIDGKIEVVRHCREQGVPYLGICLGFQVAVIEFARHVLRIATATSTEFDPNSPDAIISELPDQKRVEGLGGTMRLGAQDVDILAGSLAQFLYAGADSIRERFRHRYEVDPIYIERLEAAGLFFSGRHPEQPIMQLLELAQPADDDDGDAGSSPGAPRVTHPYFVAGQFHPELTSRPLAPQPMFMGLCAAAIARGLDPAEVASQSDLSRWVRLPSNPHAPTT
ncbi:MAG: CTP synthase, partial [Planctomycetota bacterium]